MAELTLKFPSPDGPGWVRFSREIDGARKDMTMIGRQMQSGQWKLTAQNIDRLIDIVLLFVPATSPEDKAAARETILDFSFSEMNDAFVSVGRLLAEGKELIDKQIEAQQEQLDAMAQIEE